jgi:RNA polymerase sigma factor (sigma-70 family)
MHSPHAVSLPLIAKIAVETPALSSPEAERAGLRFREERLHALSQEDSALVAAVIARRKGAARRFIECHDAFLRSVIRSASPAAGPVVDDLMHEAYVHLWRDEFSVLRRWRRVHPLRAYLRSVVTRLVWERLTRLQPAWEQLEADPLLVVQEPTPVPPTTPEDAALTNEAFRTLLMALGTLSPSQRRIIELRYYGDLSYREMGDALGITPTNAGVRLARALAQLREALHQATARYDCPGRGDRGSRPAVIKSAARPSCWLGKGRCAA